MTNSNVSFLLLETIFLFGAQIRSAWKAELFELKVSAVTETFRSSNCIFICLQIQMDMNLYNLHDINIILCLLYYVNYYNNLQNLYSNICEYIYIYIVLTLSLWSWTKRNLKKNSWSCLHFLSDNEPNRIFKKSSWSCLHFFSGHDSNFFFKKKKFINKLDRPARSYSIHFGKKQKSIQLSDVQPSWYFFYGSLITCSQFSSNPIRLG